MINMLCDEMVILYSKFSFLSHFVHKNFLLSFGLGICVSALIFSDEEWKMRLFQLQQDMPLS